MAHRQYILQYTRTRDPRIFILFQPFLLPFPYSSPPAIFRSINQKPLYLLPLLRYSRPAAGELPSHSSPHPPPQARDSARERSGNDGANMGSKPRWLCPHETAYEHIMSRFLQREGGRSIQTHIWGRRMNLPHIYVEEDGSSIHT